MRVFQIVIVSILIINFGCLTQTKKNMESTNPLICNPENGICEIPIVETNSELDIIEQKTLKPIKIIYFTDPICSSCWGIEPQLRKLKLEYGESIEIEYRMGGLLPDWSYNSGGISKPSDVAHHWDQVSKYYDMPIDGDVWLQDPLHSSYPPSIAFKAAQIQDDKKAILFLREIREMVFLKKINITKWEYLEMAGKRVGLDLAKFKTDYHGNAKLNFEEDLKLGRQLKVKGFPTLFIKDTMGPINMIYGSKPYHIFENAMLKFYPKLPKTNYDRSWDSLFLFYNSLTAKEFSVLSGMERIKSEQFLNDLSKRGKLEKLNTKNGAIWSMKKSGN